MDFWVFFLIFAIETHIEIYAILSWGFDFKMNFGRWNFSFLSVALADLNILNV